MRMNYVVLIEIGFFEGGTKKSAIKPIMGKVLQVYSQR